MTSLIIKPTNIKYKKGRGQYNPVEVWSPRTRKRFTNNYVHSPVWAQKSEAKDKYVSNYSGDFSKRNPKKGSKKPGSRTAGMSSASMNSTNRSKKHYRKLDHNLYKTTRDNLILQSGTKYETKKKIRRKHLKYKQQKSSGSHRSIFNTRRKTVSQKHFRSQSDVFSGKFHAKKFLTTSPYKDYETKRLMHTNRIFKRVKKVYEESKRNYGNLRKRTHFSPLKAGIDDINTGVTKKEVRRGPVKSRDVVYVEHQQHKNERAEVRKNMGPNVRMGAGKKRGTRSKKKIAYALSTTSKKKEMREKAKEEKKKDIAPVVVKKKEVEKEIKVKKEVTVVLNDVPKLVEKKEVVPVKKDVVVEKKEVVPVKKEVVVEKKIEVVGKGKEEKVLKMDDVVLIEEKK